MTATRLNESPGHKKNDVHRIHRPCIHGSVCIGAVSGVGYTGTTWNGQPFSFSLLGFEESTSQKKYDALRIKGAIGVDAKRAGTSVSLALSSKAR